MRKPDWETGDGSVRLYCADARDVLPELANGSIGMIFTDPPYGHNNNNGDLIHRREAALGRLPSGCDSPPAKARPIANDGAEANELVQWLFGEAKRLLAPGCCCCCCCCGGGPDPQFARWSLWMDQSLDFKQMVVWDKGPMGMGWHYRRSYETVLVGQRGGAACKWYDDTDAIENVIRPGYRGIRKIIPQADDHPTAKPVELAEHFIALHTLPPGDVVLDPFMGHATTGVAAVRLSRPFIGCELDPDHFRRAVRRIEAELARHPLLEPPPRIVTRELFPEESDA